MSVLVAADYVVFALSLAICAVIGFYYVAAERLRGSNSSIALRNMVRFVQTTICRKPPPPPTIQTSQSTATITTTEYFMGNRQTALIPTAFSMFASFFSAIGLLGLPAEIYTIGSKAILGTFSFVPSSFIIAFCFIPIYYRNNFSSIFEYIEKRFESVLLRKLATTISAIANIVYAAVCAYIPCVAFEQATGIPEWVLVIGTGAITVFYTAVGGLKAVILVDTIQALIMFAGIIAVLIFGSISVGGLEKAWQVAERDGRIQFYDFRIDPTISHSVWSIFFGSIIYFAATANNQATLQRSCSQRSLPRAMLTMLLAGPIVVLLTVILWLSTIIAYAYFTDVERCDPLTNGIIKSPNQIMSHFVSVLMNYPGFLGLYFASLFSGALSSMSTSYNTVSSMIWEDWLKDWLEPRLSRRQISLLVKAICVVVGIITSALALSCKYVGGTAIRMVSSMLGAFAGLIFAVFVIGAFLPFLSTLSVIVALLVGGPFVLWVILSQIVYQLGRYPYLPFPAKDCSASQTYGAVMTAQTTQQTVQATSAADVLPDSLRYGLLSLSYNYFPIFCVVVVIVIASIVTLVTRIIYGFYPTKAFLVKPCNVSIDLLAYGWWAELCCRQKSSSASVLDSKIAADVSSKSEDYFKPHGVSFKAGVDELDEPNVRFYGNNFASNDLYGSTTSYSGLCYNIPMTRDYQHQSSTTSIGAPLRGISVTSMASDLSAQECQSNHLQIKKNAPTLRFATDV